MNKTDILGVEVDELTLDQASSTIDEWIRLGRVKPLVVVTPNVEFIMAASKDLEFKNILNQADLRIPDSARIGWAEKVIGTKSLVKRLALIPFVFLPKAVSSFPVTTGVDLIGNLASLSEQKGYSIALIGGKIGVAKKTSERLIKDYPNLKIAWVEAGPKVDLDGNNLSDFNIPKISSDILLVAFGQVKQEKWIYKNLDKLNTKVVMGVGGAFDYISGTIPRAPKVVRSLGFEWLYRLIMEPWRIKRQLQLIKFVHLIVFKS